MSKSHGGYWRGDISARGARRSCALRVSVVLGACASLVSGSGACTGQPFTSGQGGADGAGGARAECAAGLVACDGECADLDVDPLHCGDCNMPCETGQDCLDGACECQLGLEACGGSCVDFQSAPDHCGDCGVACGAEQVCSRGACSDDCAAELVECSAACVDVSSSSRYCGSCDVACASSQSCAEGECVCNGGGTACADRCVDLATDATNCGRCGNRCQSSERCAGGECTSESGPDGGSGTGGSGAGGTSGGGSGANGGAGQASGSGGGPINVGAPIGWASVAALDVDGTTGGGDAPPSTPASVATLRMLAADAEPRTILLSGTTNLESTPLEVASNKTLLGVGPDALLLGGVDVGGDADVAVSNVIIQNLGIDASGGIDAVQVYNAHHVWIDHCEIWDAPDGNIDIVVGSDYVTVSWTKLWFTPAETRAFAVLIGDSDTRTTDRGKLGVTFHHNWWASGIVERMPRARFGDIHIFNDYYSASGNDHAIQAGLESRLLLENNYFLAVNDPHIFLDANDTSVLIVESGNEYASTTGLMQTGLGAREAFDPPYPYTLDDALDVPDIVAAGAGPR